MASQMSFVGHSWLTDCWLVGFILQKTRARGIPDALQGQRGHTRQGSALIFSAPVVWRQLTGLNDSRVGSKNASVQHIWAGVNSRFNLCIGRAFNKDFVFHVQCLPFVMKKPYLTIFTFWNEKWRSFEEFGGQVSSSSSSLQNLTLWFWLFLLWERTLISRPRQSINNQTGNVSPCLTSSSWWDICSRNFRDKTWGFSLFASTLHYYGDRSLGGSCFGARWSHNRGRHTERRAVCAVGPHIQRVSDFIPPFSQQVIHSIGSVSRPGRHSVGVSVRSVGNCCTKYRTRK